MPGNDTSVLFHTKQIEETSGKYTVRKLSCPISDSGDRNELIKGKIIASWGRNAW
jgi:hypothetical protein